MKVGFCSSPLSTLELLNSKGFKSVICYQTGARILIMREHLNRRLIMAFWVSILAVTKMYLNKSVRLSKCS